MSLKKCTQTVTSLILICISFSTVNAQKSVFIISKHSNPSHAQAYAIDGNDVTYQADVDISTYNTYDQGAGAVGNAVWPEKELMFVTYESSGVIVWSSTKTLQKVGEFDTNISGFNGAGIVCDQTNEKIYLIDRSEDDLYVYSFDEPNNTLVLDNHYELDVPSGYLYAWGIALDEINRLLYISTNTKTVHIYDTNDWSHDHYIDIEVGGTERPAVGIAVDPNRGYLYTGHWTSHYYLVKTDTTSPYTSTEKLVGQAVIGLDVDEEAGLVYCTTYNDDFRVYDSNLVLHDTEVNDIDGPAGVAVGGLYKPPAFDVNKFDNVNDVDCAYPWNIIDENYLVYNICYDANGYADTNVIITDYLPVEVDYYSSSSDPCGYYDPNTHMVTWVINDISGADSNCLQLTVKVNQYARPGETIINLCEMEGDQYYKSATEDTTICCYGGDIIYVDRDVNGFDNGTSWLDAYKDLQDALAGATNCDCNQIRVAQQTYKPTDINDTSARLISFELLDDVDVYGGFPPGGGAWGERNPSVYETILSGDIGTPDYQYDNSYHVVKCEDVNNAVLDGFTITAGNALDSGYKGCGIYCKDSNNLTVRNCVISQNETGTGYGYGGGIYFKDSTNLAVTDCNFSDNTSYFGGALYNESSDLNINNCIFSNNSAYGGVAVYNKSSDPNITNCIFTGNTGYLGGGIYSEYSALNVTNCVFAGNIVTAATSKGGGMYNQNCSWVAIADCIFTGNSSDNYGGGLYNENSTLKVTNSVFAGNAAWEGGGIRNVYYSDVNVTNCIFTGNWAGAYGGGIASYDKISLALTNCTVSGNSSAYYGGGIYSWSYADTNLTNCIFWGNEAAVDDEICKDASSDVNVTYSDVKGGWEGDGNIDEDPCFFDVEQSGPWTADASYDNSTFQSTLTNTNASWTVNQLAGKFVNPNTNQNLLFFIVSNDVNTIKVWSDVRSIAEESDPYHIYDYHLTADSACIDTGDPDYNPDPNMTDMDGERRVFDGDANEIPIVDMGADEYYWSPADFISDGLVDFFDYALFANVWLTTPNDVNYYDDIYDLVDNDCIDSNDLARFCEDWLWQTAWAKTFPFAYEKTMGRSMGKSMGESPGLTQDLFMSVSAKQDQPELTASDIEEILKWLADLWLTEDELRKMISEDEWLKFMESVIQVLKEGIQN